VTEKDVKRRLAAIFSADVKEYSLSRMQIHLYRKKKEKRG